MNFSFGIGSGKRATNTQAWRSLTRTHYRQMSIKLHMLATHLPDFGRYCGDSLTLHQRTLVTLS